MDPDPSALLDRAIGGDPGAVTLMSRFDHTALLEAQSAARQPLIVTRQATVGVLRGLLDHRFAPLAVQAWASLMRWGFIVRPEVRVPIKPIEIEFDEACEESISEILSRLDELGDVIDGEVTSGEILELLQLLGEP